MLCPTVSRNFPSLIFFGALFRQLLAVYWLDLFVYLSQLSENYWLRLLSQLRVDSFVQVRKSNVQTIRSMRMI
jgi:hypothetical protein